MVGTIRNQLTGARTMKKEEHIKEMAEKLANKVLTHYQKAKNRKGQCWDYTVAESFEIIIKNTKYYDKFPMFNPKIIHQTLSRAIFLCCHCAEFDDMFKISKVNEANIIDSYWEQSYLYAFEIGTKIQENRDKDIIRHVLKQKYSDKETIYEILNSLCMDERSDYQNDIEANDESS
jgi:hypothetical protein